MTRDEAIQYMAQAFAFDRSVDFLDIAELYPLYDENECDDSLLREIHRRANGLLQDRVPDRDLVREAADVLSFSS